MNPATYIHTMSQNFLPSFASKLDLKQKRHGSLGKTSIKLHFSKRILVFHKCKNNDIYTEGEIYQWHRLVFADFFTSFN